MLLSAEHISINFGMKQLLTDVNLYLNEGDKIGIIGINGTGKSTFLKVLAGVIPSDEGRITRNPNVQVSYLSQNPQMDDNATILEQVFLHFPADFRELNEYEAKSMLTKLGFTDFDRRSAPSPVVSGSVWPWLPPWFVRRIFSSWTSPPTIWTAGWWPGWKIGFGDSGEVL